MVKILAKTVAIAILFIGILAWGAGAFTIQPQIHPFMAAQLSSFSTYQDPSSELLLEPAVDPRIFDTMDLAAKYALQNAYIHSNIVEYGGAIYLHKDKYRFAYPVTDRKVASVWIPVKVYNGWQVVATFHTHPCMPYTHGTQYFSDADVAGSIYDGIPYYMGNLCKGSVNKFDPRVDKPDDATWRSYKVTTGRVVGNFYLFKQPIVVEDDPDGESSKNDSSH